MDIKKCPDCGTLYTGNILRCDCRREKRVRDRGMGYLRQNKRRRQKKK